LVEVSGIEPLTS